jgi:NAD+ synthase (glutamine-hydrolysing)
MRTGQEFFNLYNHDFVRVAVGVPRVRVADPGFNAEQTITLIGKAAASQSALVLFPELGLSAYSCDDLFQQSALLNGCQEALQTILDASRKFPIVAIVGLPLRIDHLLFNCAVVLAEGKILGVIPKTYLPNYREFYEFRQFAPGDAAARTSLELCGQCDIPFGARLLFQFDQQPLLTFSIEICEDLWVPIPLSSYGALAGATVLLNLSASNVTIAKADYRRQLVASQSARCLAAYLYAAAGFGESTTDLAWDGQAIICENGTILVESERFSLEPQLITSEVDLERLSQERMRQTSFGQAVIREKSQLENFRMIRCSVRLPREQRLLLQRTFERFPYVPADPARRDERCSEVFQIQVHGLAKRLDATGIRRVVIGVSGGLDSTHALLVSARAMDLLGYPRTQILGCTMPGFATTARTLKQAHALIEAVGCEAREIDIRPSCLDMFRDIQHPFSQGSKVYDVTFENVQAGERTSHLFRLANLSEGLVVGTSDLSELALGWCTYGVGDHMAHYSVNASVPKTLVKHVIRWVAETNQLGENARTVLDDILATEVSPELVPGGTNEAQPHQRSEAVIGPYDLQDFHLYYTLRFGCAPPKLAFLAFCAWHDRTLGAWPDVAIEGRHDYTLEEIKANLRIFLNRFFKLSQFKRSCLPNGPKVGSGGSLSPRGDYRAPSDSEVAPWLAQLDLIPNSRQKQHGEN